MTATETPEQTSYIQTPTGVVLVGSCLDRLRDLDDASVDSVVTDPPYEIGFMGKGWDGTGIAYSVELWAECLRVLKPGGHVLAFGATRSYHRMACAIEDAGFEIRDSVHWSYGSGFPKSLAVDKAIDKQIGREEAGLAQRVADAGLVAKWLVDRMAERNITRSNICEHFNAENIAQQWTTYWTDGAVKPRVPSCEQWRELREWLDLPDDMDAEVWRLNGMKGELAPLAFEREVVGQRAASVAAEEDKRGAKGLAFGKREMGLVDITAPATPAAAQWEGWGTALKPSHEPIVVARKPLEGTVAGNVLAYGTGALNVDGCRVGASEADREEMSGRSGRRTEGDLFTGKGDGQAWEPRASGRWPANSVFTHNWDCDGACTSGCPVADLDSQSGNRKVGAVRPYQQKHTGDTPSSFSHAVSLERDYTSPASEGGASRFFTQANWDPQFDQPVLYYAKPSKRERNAGLDHLEAGKALYTEGTGLSKNGDGSVSIPDAARQNTHPTVKPVALMRHLCRLVTPPGGVVLDPFLGSGTTAVAAILEGFQWVGCEMTADYLPIISGRVAHAEKQNKQLELPL